jgi:hypothetical protein
MLVVRQPSCATWSSLWSSSSSPDFLGALYRSWWLPLDRQLPGCLEEQVAMIPSSGVMAPVGLDASKLRPPSWIPSRSGQDRTCVLSGRM